MSHQTPDPEFNSYVPGVFQSAQAQKADALFLGIRRHLGLAKAMSVQANSLLFEIKQRELRTTADERKQRAAAIKHATNRASYQCHVDAFEHYLLRIIDDAEKLAALVPELKADCLCNYSDPDKAFVRKCNTVACSRLLSGLAEQTMTMCIACIPPSLDAGAQDAVDNGSNDLNERLRAIGKRHKADLFHDLSVPFVSEASDLPVHAAVEERLFALIRADQRTQADLDLFFRRKSAFFSSSVNRKLVDVANVEEAYRILDVYEGVTIDYQRSRWGLVASMRVLEEALEQLLSAMRASRNYMTRRHDLVSVLCNNLLAAQVEVFTAERLLDRCHKQLAESPNEHAGTDSRKAISVAFDSVPADFNLPRRYQLRSM